MLRPPSYQYRLPFESDPMNSRSFWGGVWEEQYSFGMQFKGNVAV